MRIFGPKFTSVEKEQDPSYPKLTGAGYLQVIDELENILMPQWYLEIGSRTGTSLMARRCSFVAIDPIFKLKSADFLCEGNSLLFRQTSDDFFASGFLHRNDIQPRLAFIDGMHKFEFALRDFINCEKTMDPHGVVCLHDVLPFNGPMTTRNEDYLNVGTAWTGDVWKIVPILKKYRPDLKVDVLDAPRTGLCCVSGLNPADETLSENMEAIVKEYMPIDLTKTGPGFYFDTIDLTCLAKYLHSFSGRSHWVRSAT